MKVVLRTVLRSCDLAQPTGALERTRRRSITFSPAAGATVVLHDRVISPRAAVDGELVTL
jgi:hypothetical protein